MKKVRYRQNHNQALQSLQLLRLAPQRNVWTIYVPCADKILPKLYHRRYTWQISSALVFISEQNTFSAIHNFIIPIYSVRLLVCVAVVLGFCGKNPKHWFYCICCSKINRFWVQVPIHEKTPAEMIGMLPDDEFFMVSKFDIFTLSPSKVNDGMGIAPPTYIIYFFKWTNVFH